MLSLLKAWIWIHDGTNHCHDLQSRYSTRTQVEDLAYLFPYPSGSCNHRFIRCYSRRNNKLQTMLSQAHTISDCKLQLVRKDLRINNGSTPNPKKLKTQLFTKNYSCLNVRIRLLSKTSKDSKPFSEKGILKQNWASLILEIWILLKLKERRV